MQSKCSKCNKIITTWASGHHEVHSDMNKIPHMDFVKARLLSFQHLMLWELCKSTGLLHFLPFNITLSSPQFVFTQMINNFVSLPRFYCYQLAHNWASRSIRRRKLTMALPDIAGALMVFEYCEAKIKGKPTLSKVPQSLSCFEQTLPVSVRYFPSTFYFNDIYYDTQRLNDYSLSLASLICHVHKLSKFVGGSTRSIASYVRSAHTWHNNFIAL